MVIALLACLAGTVITGVMAYGERGEGPLASIMSAPTQNVRAVGDNAEHASRPSKREDGEGVVGELHATLANITLVLVILHLLGVALASVVHRENLVASMIHGRKHGAS
jgi:cytochrome b